MGDPGAVGNRIDQRWATARLVLAAVWLVVGVAALQGHPRDATFGELLAAVDAGQVDSVTVYGDGLEPGTSGYARQEIRWDEGWWPNQETVVTHVVGEQDTASLPDPLGAPAADVLAERDPGLSIATQSDLPSSTTWWGVAWLGVGLATLFILVNGPQPWRASRWGWFWPFALLPVLGGLAFCLLSGRSPGLPTPPDPARRIPKLTTFLIALVLAYAGKTLLDL